MTELGAFREPQSPSGVYLIDETQRDRIARGALFPARYRIAILDGAEAGSREGFFTAIARELTFPAYFGRNWDAVYDCLTDPSVLPADGCAIVLDGYDHLATSQPDQWRIALQVLRDACAFWRPLDRPLYVLLYASGHANASEP
jgi:RNAse (barnase) inhibitor barstar